MLLGLFAILITLTMPKGMAGLLADRFDIQIFPLRRRVRLRNSQDTIEPDLTSALGRSQKS